MYFIKKNGLREFDWLGRKGKKTIKEWDLFHKYKYHFLVIKNSQPQKIWMCLCFASYCISSFPLWFLRYQLSVDTSKELFERL